MYGLRGRTIKHLVLNESQYAKNDSTATHRAIKALDYETLIALSGTLLCNKWHDIYGTLNLMPAGNPFRKFNLERERSGMAGTFEGI